MNRKKFSEMTEWELKEEIAKAREEARKAEQLGMTNRFAIMERKAAIAESYLLNPEDFQPGEIYAIKGMPNTYFRIDYVNGVMAWGYRLNNPGKQEALPISLLEK